MFYDPGMKTRHVWLIPPLGVGRTRQGLVLAWRQKPAQRSSPAYWEAQVIWVDDRTGQASIEWIPSVYLTPVASSGPLA